MVRRHRLAATSGTIPTRAPVSTIRHTASKLAPATSRRRTLLTIVIADGETPRTQVVTLEASASRIASGSFAKRNDECVPMRGRGFVERLDWGNAVTHTRVINPGGI